MFKSLNIGIITKYEGNSYHGALINAIHQALRNNNANMFIINTFMINRFCKEPKRDLLYSKLASNHIHGWIILSEGAKDGFIHELIKTGKPVVTVGFTPEDAGCIIIREDSRHGARAVTQHLIDHGHKRIVFIGCSHLKDMQERFLGYKSILDDYSIPFDPELTFNSDITDIDMTLYAKGAIIQLIEKKCEFTAVFAANDIMAIGAIEALKERNLRVPEDVAVIGYDDSFHARASNPKLSSVSQDLSGIGNAAVEAVLKSIVEETLQHETILIKSKIIIRNSCGCEINSSDDVIEAFPGDVNLKNNMIEYQQKEIGKSYVLASKLMTTNIDGLKTLIPAIVSNSPIKCVGFWQEDKNNDKTLVIEQLFDKSSNKEINPNTVCPIESFPPVEFLKHSTPPCTEDILWILPVTTISRGWCIMAYFSPINITNIVFTYDSTVILYNLLGIFLDHVIANTELKKTLETLQQTQEQLINSEKMVSLGRLVAGIAHEINTPIGVSITAASYLKESSMKMEKMYSAGSIKRSDLTDYLNTNSENADILLVNLNRASELVKSFKQIAVDQSVEEKRLFNLKEYISGVLLSLKPKLKKTGISVKVDCSDDLTLYNYAGGLSQILSNFVLNSILHAFNEGERGLITITAFIEENMLNLIYSDDGKGIAHEDLHKIFEPFFTTKRGKGGTGLGLNIVYNLVTQKYGGSIVCESLPGKGTVFKIKIPV
jgi:DNA-binding LacI/PurR family transcriptional regulator/signal transduction histidine kinase